MIKDIAETQANSRAKSDQLILIIGGALTFFAALIRIYLRTTIKPSWPRSIRPVARRDLFLAGAAAVGTHCGSRICCAPAGCGRRIPIRRGVGARWITYTLLMLVVAVIVASCCPRNTRWACSARWAICCRHHADRDQRSSTSSLRCSIILLSLFSPNIQAGRPLTARRPNRSRRRTPGTPPPSCPSSCSR